MLYYSDSDLSTSVIKNYTEPTWMMLECLIPPLYNLTYSQVLRFLMWSSLREIVIMPSKQEVIFKEEKWIYLIHLFKKMDHES